MERKTMLLMELDEKGIHTKISGSPFDIMRMATEALKICKEALEKHPDIGRNDSVRLMDEVVENYQTEAHFGKEAATLRAIIQVVKHC